MRIGRWAWSWELEREDRVPLSGNSLGAIDEETSQHGRQDANQQEGSGPVGRESHPPRLLQAESESGRRKWARMRRTVKSGTAREAAVREVICVRICNTRISQQRQQGSGDGSRGYHWIEQVQQYEQQSDRLKWTGVMQHAGKSGGPGQGCFGGDLDAQHAAGGESTEGWEW